MALDWNSFAQQARAQAGRPLPTDVEPAAPVQPEPTVVYVGDAASVARARNGLAAYMAAFGKTLPPTGTPVDDGMLSWAELKRRGDKIRADIDSVPSVPNEASRPAQANPRPWMQEKGRPIRSRHARRG